VNKACAEASIDGKRKYDLDLSWYKSGNRKDAWSDESTIIDGGKLDAGSHVFRERVYP